MKSIFKNFLFVIRRFKTSTVLNILGLSIAYAAFIIIMIQVDYDQSFDKFHPQSELIYRVEMDYGDGTKIAVMSRPLADVLFRSSPHIKAGAILNPWAPSTLFTVDKNGAQVSFLESVSETYSDFTKVFGLTMIEGKENALEEPNTVIIPQSMAEKFFGSEPALGKQLKYANRSNENDILIIGGVYKDFEANSSLQNTIYQEIGKERDVNQWGNSNYYIYVLLDSPDAVSTIIDNFKSYIPEDVLKDRFSSEGAKIQFTKLPDLHFANDIQYDFTPKSSHQTIIVLYAIAIAIIIIAGINFTNFSMALAPMRIRTINTRKVLGASDDRQRIALLSEAFIMSNIAFLIALLLVYISSFTPITYLVDAHIVLMAYPMLILITAFIAAVAGILSGVYPAVYLTSFQPAFVLKGSFASTPQGKKLRIILVGAQFLASMILIISAYFMYLQNDYMQKVPLGYNRGQIITTELNVKARENRSTLTNELKMYSGIEGVSYSQVLLGTQDVYMGWGRKYKDKDINYQVISVDPSFLRVMDIKVNEGRDFREDDKDVDHGKYIFNEKAKNEYELEVNADIEGSEIVGFMDDIQFTTFYKTPTPMAFYVWGKNNWGDLLNFAYIKVKEGANMHEARKHIENTLSKIDPDYPFQVRFYDDAMENVYQKERRLTLLITVFSAIAILISIIGVFGLVVFEAQYRRREVSIRKVLGSSVEEIIRLFSKTYVIILGVCFVIACPIAWYVINNWLENFAYRTPIHWWVFLVGGLTVSIITIITISMQSYRTATENPVNALKGE